MQRRVPSRKKRERGDYFFRTPRMPPLFPPNGKKYFAAAKRQKSGKKTAKYFAAAKKRQNFGDERWSILCEQCFTKLRS